MMLGGPSMGDESNPMMHQTTNLLMDDKNIVMETDEHHMSNFGDNQQVESSRNSKAVASRADKSGSPFNQNADNASHLQPVPGNQS